MSKPGRPEFDWLHRSPRGIVAQWAKGKHQELQTYEVMDESVCLMNRWQDMGPENFGYRPDQVTMSIAGSAKNLLVPAKGTELWAIRDSYANEQKKIAYDPKRSKELDANGPKLHLYQMTAWLTDRTISHFGMYYSDWYNVRTLNIGLRDGKIPEHYRNDIMPSLLGDHYVFQSAHPNWATVHGVVITSDEHIILTKQVTKADFHADAVSATSEEQMNGILDNSPFDTFFRMVDLNPKMKLAGKGGEELRLHIKSGRVGLAAVILEPDVNGAGFIIMGQCEEASEEIDARILGRDKSEFDPTRPIWTLPLKDPDLAIKQLVTPPFLWHGSSIFRLVTALSAVHGFEEIMSSAILKDNISKN